MTQSERNRSAREVATLRVQTSPGLAPGQRLMRSCARSEIEKMWPKPRIGVLLHHPPKQLRVPRSYFSATAPDPAPLISIVTPSLQQGAFLRRTIDSVLGQGYTALEYIVQDGGST